MILLKTFCIAYIALMMIGILGSIAYSIYAHVMKKKGKPYLKCWFPICKEADGYIYPDNYKPKTMDKEKIREELDAFIESGKAKVEVNSGNFVTTHIDPMKFLLASREGLYREC